MSRDAAPLSSPALTLRAAGATDVGRQRDVNEDRFHIDRDRRLFMVVDGVGGQAAGGRAADTALEMIRARLAGGNGALADRIRDAITIANNEVHRQAASRAEWRGMACVLTVAAIDGDRLTVGHVGDTRLYKLRAGAMQKITPDHSPVGEREDAGELSELDAMRHPRRNEVYRDVGSEPHEASDAEFVEIREVAWEPDAALLLCSDGLTDLLPSTTIQGVVARMAGHPDQVVRALVKAANDAGGKDNITVVYVEGDEFKTDVVESHGRSGARLFQAIVWLLAAAALVLGWRSAGYPSPDAVAKALGIAGDRALVVRPGESIAAALSQALPGATILVEPGEYRERLSLKDAVRLVSRLPRGAILRLPGTATDADVAVTASNVSDAELNGFRIVGDAATPLGTGVMVGGASVRLIDLEVTGAAKSALDLGPGDVLVLGSEIHDNPGAGLIVRAGSTARIAHNVFSRNGSSELAASALLVEPGAQPVFQKNVLHGIDPQTYPGLDDTARRQLKTDNWFPDARPATVGPAPARGRGR